MARLGTLPPLITHTLLLLALVALGNAGLRAAAALGGAGAMRLLAAAAIAATAAGMWTLALGLIGLGSSPVLLTVAAGATWLAANRLLPRPRLGASTELALRWNELPLPMRVAFGAAAGGLIALAAWCLHKPALVGDGLAYHVPVVIGWVQGGDAPAQHPVTTDFPLESYPLTAELLVAWATGIARSFVPISLMNPAMLALLALAAWSGLRALGASRLATALAVAALGTSPLLVSQLNTFTTDLPALAWLTCCAALCAGSLRAPGLLVAALLAAGLAAGIKTTALPLAAACLLAAAIARRQRLRPLAVPLAVAGLAAAVVGGLWYVRNLILHGSPLWPFVTTPWGDPVPFWFGHIDGQLLMEPSSADGRLDDYGRALWGGVALLGGGLTAWLMARRRRVLVASAATGLAFLIWANAPFTAFPDGPIFDGLQGGSTRYLLPALAAGAAALGLAATASGVGGRVAMAVLVAAVAANVVGDARLGLIGDFEPAVAFEVDPILPSAVVPLAGAAAGAALVALTISTPRRGPRLDWPFGRATWALASVLAGALLALTASGYVKRSTALASSPRGAAWLVREQGYDEDDAPVALQARIIATLAGDRLRHRLSLMPPQGDCAEIRAAAADGWLVINISEVPAVVADAEGFAEYARSVQARELETARCLDDRVAAYRDPQVRIYAPGAGPLAGRTGIAKKSTVSRLSAGPPS